MTNQNSCLFAMLKSIIHYLAVIISCILCIVLLPTGNTIALATWFLELLWDPVLKYLLIIVGIPLVVFGLVAIIFPSNTDTEQSSNIPSKKQQSSAEDKGLSPIGYMMVGWATWNLLSSVSKSESKSNTEPELKETQSITEKESPKSIHKKLKKEISQEISQEISKKIKKYEEKQGKQPTEKSEAKVHNDSELTFIPKDIKQSELDIKFETLGSLIDEKLKDLQGH